MVQWCWESCVAPFLVHNSSESSSVPTHVRVHVFVHVSVDVYTYYYKGVLYCSRASLVQNQPARSFTCSSRDPLGQCAVSVSEVRCLVSPSFPHPAEARGATSCVHFSPPSQFLPFPNSVWTSFSSYPCFLRINSFFSLNASIFKMFILERQQCTEVKNTKSGAKLPWFQHCFPHCLTWFNPLGPRFPHL